MAKLIFILLAVLVSSSLGLYGSDSKVVKLTTSNFKDQVLNSKELWFVEFYAPWCGHCKSLAPEWEKLAKALDGIIKVGAVDMTTDQEAGSPYGVKGFPTIKFFGADKKNPNEYNGGRTANDLISFAFKEAKNVAETRLKGKSSSSSSGSNDRSGGSHGGSQGGSNAGSGSSSDVIVLTDSNFDDLVINSQDTWMVEFYAPWCGHCQRLEPEWNSAATKLKGEVKVGKIDATQEGGLASRFGVNGYPTIKFFPPGGKTDSSAENYEGARDAAAIAEWALDRKTALKPLAKVEQLVDQETFDQACVNHKGICFIAFLPHIYDSSAEERNQYIETFQELSKSHRSSPVRFLWSQGGDHLPLEDSLVLGSGYPSLIAISVNKQKYAPLRAAFNKKSIDSFITGLLAGKEPLFNLSKLPSIKKAKSWDGNDSKLSVKD